MVEKVKHSGLALTVLALAQFMVVLDATIVNVALPAIQQALGFTNDAQLQWMITAYALAFGGFLLLGGRLADLFGRRRIFITGIVLFALASLLCGVAQNPAQAIGFRALQGLGGALLAPSALSLVLTIFKEGPARNKALGVWGMVAAGGGAVGLLLGGVLTQYVDWRWIFFINLPVGIAVLLATFRWVPASTQTKKQSLDVLGAITVTLSLMSLVYALASAAQHGWSNGGTVGAFIAAAVLMIVFIINERRASHPLVTLGIFKRRNVTGGTLMNLLLPASMFGMFFYLSIYEQHILGYSPTHTGLANLPFTMTIMVVASILSPRIGKINARLVLVFAPLVVAAGLLFFSRIPVHANYWTDILPGIIIMATGMSMVFITGTVVTTSGSSHEESGLISGLLNTGQQVGGAIGLAVLTVISTAVTRNELTVSQGDPTLVPGALVHGFQRGFMVAAGFAVIASFIALLVLRTVKLSPKELERLPENEDEALPAIPGV